MILSYNDTIMSTNQINHHRFAKGWSQAELAERAGISRAAVSAIEMDRLVPSVSTALSLAAVFECSVEELFGTPRQNPSHEWAWQPSVKPSRYWQAAVGQRLLKYPVESTSVSSQPHDGVGEGMAKLRDGDDPRRTLVLASCDPAAGLLATEFNRVTGFRIIVLQRSSRKALELLKHGHVHAAGIHFATSDSPDCNEREVELTLGKDRSHQLLRLADWQEGLAIAQGAGVSNVSAALKSKLRWIGREPGSAARQCLEEIAPKKPAPKRIAFDHRGVAEAIRQNWVDLGICHRLAAEEAGLQFVPVRQEGFDLCYSSETADDPRMKGLLQFIRSSRYRTLFGELPGINTRHAGDTRRVC
jgi:molybdate-binding protein/DNA-binding XRE family transcriptional regulator